MYRRTIGTAVLVGWIAATIPLMRGTCAGTTADGKSGKTLIYYVAADEVNWNHAPGGRDEAMGMDFDTVGKGYVDPGPHQIGSINKKAIYREYMDASFTKLKARNPEDAYLGVLGPIFHGEVGDTFKIAFRNNATHPFSVHPHGVLYQKDSEGADYNDNTSGKDKEDGCVASGATHTYTWEIQTGPAQMRKIPIPSSGCITRTAMTFVMLRPVYSEALSLGDAAKHCLTPW